MRYLESQLGQRSPHGTLDGDYPLLAATMMLQDAMVDQLSNRPAWDILYDAYVIALRELLAALK